MNHIDITKVPFTRYGCRLSVTTVSSTSPLRVVNVHQMFGEDQALMVDFTRGGRPVDYLVTATPSAITVASDAGRARLFVQSDDGLAIESDGLEVELLALDSKRDVRKPSPLAEIPIITAQSTDTRKVIDIRCGDLATLDVLRGKADVRTDRVTISPDCGRSLSLLRIGRSVPEGVPTIDVEPGIAESAAEWEAFLAKMPPAPEDRRKQAEAAWHVLWSSFIRAGGVLPYDSMFVNKDFMNGVWSWDHCFHALGIARADFGAAIEQFLLPFALQDGEGKLPDVWKSPDVVFWGILKPPVHGWCLMRLMEMGDIDRATLERIYGHLVRWTEFWFSHRDDDGDGVPNYSANGCDSGMDNATVFDSGARMECPDLSAYLVLQMKALAVVARKLGDDAAAMTWDERAERLLAALYEHCWRGDRFVCVTSGTHEFDAAPTALLPLMPIALGELLDKDKFELCVAELERRFLTPYGIASEDPKSPKYEIDSYWRGPIWASSTCLIVDGLRRGGREDLAKEIARRYCDMMRYPAGGTFECHDALNGSGLRAPGFSWTAAVSLYFMWEYLA